jgi:hypothetical protein
LKVLAFNMPSKARVDPYKRLEPLCSELVRQRAAFASGGLAKAGRDARDVYGLL